ncbi:diaminopimelate decarboxylase [Francisella adeliensis]|uniref:Diaminopimelate decarboxylase n=1 Tax=Francisella adeliensis TaxID=2007306 RepID=A0A2Z4XZ56_9GAMM|nr:diaminopimelate decarboxylase [Francisella adeliensis]AXA34060.1 diaminopimelate decarboxylase [Francisella adeliensis]MBK2085223.1 diaminopimelate decarboxylase [Francisella adeliensis]MBK2096009.1 diaminopimelate decarboxylase [Francisella adeliensis]QIW12299.1 diaminopimelate decarboxylase [Francisella adeliensis]QIW14173.1 diaminopimelate decarboxylase [Francisella adeliensis]
MNAFKIFNDTDLLKFADSGITTPCYIYDKNLLDATFSAAKKALDKHFDNAVIHYAIKANHNAGIIDYAKKYNMGIDCVSGGEVQRALDAGVDPSHIVFAGVGKADWEIELALDAGIFAFNCESIEEIQVINEFAKSKGVTANICIRINPDIDAQTHHYISTGQFDDKFGISFDMVEEFIFKEASTLKNIDIIGLHYHVGSQILNLNVFNDLVATVNNHLENLLDKGIEIKHINFGGGLGIDYENPEANSVVDFDEFFRNIAIGFKFKNTMQVHFELGRSLVAQSGILLSKVLYTKTTGNTDFAIIDAGMTELLRPALYQAQHKIVALTDSGSNDEKAYHVVGPICESSDIFAKHYRLPKLKRGYIVAIYSAGAYGKVLASEYNLRPTVKEYFI